MCRPFGYRHRFGHLEPFDSQASHAVVRRRASVSGPGKRACRQPVWRSGCCQVTSESTCHLWLAEWLGHALASFQALISHSRSNSSLKCGVSWWRFRSNFLNNLRSRVSAQLIAIAFSAPLAAGYNTALSPTTTADTATASS
jgi:hypothetical protein